MKKIICCLLCLGLLDDRVASREDSFGDRNAFVGMMNSSKCVILDCHRAAALNGGVPRSLSSQWGFLEEPPIM